PTRKEASPGRWPATPPSTGSRCSAPTVGGWRSPRTGAASSPARPTCSSPSGGARDHGQADPLRRRRARIAAPRRRPARRRGAGDPRAAGAQRYIAGALAERRRVAYFLVDAMRYEMGQDLAHVLDTLGSVSTTFAAMGLPPTTPCGMAALMPSADGS